MYYLPQFTIFSILANNELTKRLSAEKISNKYFQVFCVKNRKNFNNPSEPPKYSVATLSFALPTTLFYTQSALP